MIAIIPIRGGVLPFGSDETVAEAGGDVLLIGSECEEAAAALDGVAGTTWFLEVGHFSPARWADVLSSTVRDLGDAIGLRHILLPGSPDGRDLGPRLAATLDRDYVAGAIMVTEDHAEQTRYGGRTTQVVALNAPIVATLQPGVRGTGPEDRRARSAATPPAPIPLAVPPAADGCDTPADLPLLAEVPADPSTIDLAEASRIVGGGAGLGSAESFERMAELATALGASPGGTRVITDWGWLPVERQIGTTGVTVNPELYVALGVSGAVQHTAGLGAPDHVISVNTDPHCPMMGLADMAIICDGPGFLDELLSLLKAPTTGPSEDT